VLRRRPQPQARRRFWAHNDSGNPAALYAITREGELIREYAVDGAPNVDWEDLATDDAGHLYVADVGNNGGQRKEVHVYRIDEPDPRRPLAAPPFTAPPECRLAAPLPRRPVRLRGAVRPQGRRLLIPKRLTAAPAELYRFALTPAAAGPRF
jgi:hypothetical protein